MRVCGHVSLPELVLLSFFEAFFAIYKSGLCDMERLLEGSFGGGVG